MLCVLEEKGHSAVFFFGDPFGLVWIFFSVTLRDFFCIAIQSISKYCEK